MDDPTRDVHSFGDASETLISASTGDEHAAEQLLELVYEQLCGAAQQQLATERIGHTLSATALVHEAYLRLAGPRQIPWEGKAHFYAAAAQAMRRILIDHARGKKARGGVPVSLDAIPDVGVLFSAHPDKIMAVERALARLEDEDEPAAEIVRLRFFAGLSVDQAALVMGVSPRTAARLWTFARASLYQRLSEGSSEKP